MKINKNVFVLQSFAIHFLGAALVLIISLLSTSEPQSDKIQFKVIEKVVEQKKEEVQIQITQKPKPKDPPKDKPKKKPREVFGVNRKSITSEKQASPIVKQGNTVTKEVDNKKLNKDDLDELPIPKAEYLVTEMPSILSEARIRYPEKAKEMGLEGVVVLSLLIDSEGRVREAQIVEGLTNEMDQEALRAIKDYRFNPAKIEKEKVAVRIRYAIRFVLENN